MYSGSAYFDHIITLKYVSCCSAKKFVCILMTLQYSGHDGLQYT